MNQEKLEKAKKLLFIVLGIDMAANVLGAITGVWTVSILNAIRSAADISAIIGTLEFGNAMSTVMIMTMIGVGLALLHWLGSCYAYAKETLKVTGFAQEGWKTWGWVVPLMNLFKPYQVLSEIYKMGAPDYVGGDEWKKASGSRLLLAWWFFWVITHMITWSIGNKMITWAIEKQVSMSSLQDGLTLNETLNQIITVYYLSIIIFVISLVVSGLWLVVAGGLTKRLLNRLPLATVLEAPMGLSSAIGMAPSAAMLSSEVPRIAKITIAERIRPGRSLLIAALVGITWFIFLLVHEYQTSEWRLIAGNRIFREMGGSGNLDTSFLGIVDFMNGQYAASVLAASALTYALCLLVFWGLSYSHYHRGWRRIAMVSGALCGVGVVVLNEKLFVTFVIALAVAFASAVAIVIAREGFLWIWRGFGRNRREENGNFMFCSQCGTKVALDAKFCASCGGALAEYG